MQRKKIPFLCFFVLGAFLSSSAADFVPFKGRINAEDINIRCDSTVASEMIISLAKGDEVEVVAELYDWYKVRLPKGSPSYVFKDMTEPLDEKTVVVSRENVNVRLRPGVSSPILGKVNKAEVLGVLAAEGDWLKIKPVENSYGWVNKMFVDKGTAGAKAEPGRAASKTIELGKDEILIEGVIRPYGKVISRPASHKLIAEGYKTYLLNGDPERLNALNYRRARVIGKLGQAQKEKYPIIEVLRLELAD